MHKLAIVLTSISFILISVTSVAARQTVLEMVNANDLPPTSFQGENGFQGVYAEVFKALCKEAGFTPKITLMPWPRAQRTVIKGKNFVLVGIPRDEVRKPNYLWINEIYKTKTSFASLDGKSYGLEQAKKVDVILLHSGTPWEKRLVRMGFDNVEVVRNMESLALMLINGRGNLLLSPVSMVEWLWKKNNYTQKVTFGPSISSSIHWIAMSKNSDPKIVKRVGQGVEKLKTNGTFARILTQYGLRTN